MDNSRKSEILDLVKHRLLAEYGEQILSAVVYGSVFDDDFCASSDFDILIIFNQVNFETVKRLKGIRNDFAKEGVRIDFNSHVLSDLPQSRGEVFWHNNRGAYVQKELASYGKVLIGKQYFQDAAPDHTTMTTEAVRVVNSLNYQARKMIANSELDAKNRIVMMKWCIYGTIYVMAALGWFLESRRRTLSEFKRRYNPPIDPLMFLDLKIGPSAKITDEHLEMALDYLSYLDRLAFKIYKENLQ